MIHRRIARVSRHYWYRLQDLPHELSVARFHGWLSRRPRRLRMFRRFVAAIIIAVVAYLTGPRLLQYWKGAQARRMAADALRLIDQKEWEMADRKIRAAVSSRPSEPIVCLASARLLSRTGQSAAAMDGWRRLEGSSLITAADRRDYAAAALAIGDLSAANEQIGWLASQPNGPAPQDLILAAKLASKRGAADVTVRYAEKVLTGPDASALDRISAAMLIFQSEPGDFSAQAVACRGMAALARDDANPAALDALTLLAKQLMAGHACDNVMSLGEIADRLEGIPSARPLHRILARDIRVRLDPSNTDALVTSAVQSFGKGDDETLIALGAWLFELRRYETELAVIPADRASKRRELFLERVDALAALGRTGEAEEMLLGESSIIDPAVQHMRLAIIKSEAGETIAAANEWERALESAQAPYQLLAVANYAERNQALTIADAAYERAVIKQSNLRPAYISRLRLLETTEQTVKAHDVAVKITRLWPNDVTSQMHEQYLRLLLGASEEETNRAEQMAADCLYQNPRHLGARMVLALARLKQGKNSDALAAVAQSSASPGTNAPLAVRAAALAANGWTDEAAAEARKLAASKLLPEERALILPCRANDN